MQHLMGSPLHIIQQRSTKGVRDHVIAMQI